MAHLHRFHVPVETPSSGESFLSPEEARHAVRVARVRPGDEVALFDGHGREMLAEILVAGPAECRVRIHTVRRAPQPAHRLTLAQAWLNKPAAIDDVIRRGVELGVDAFIFFKARHSERAPRFSPKWGRIAVETCKQCGRLWLPSFDCVTFLDEVIGGVSASAPSAETTAVLIATKYRPPTPLRDALRGCGRALAIIGPEGDFTAEEVDSALAKGAAPIGLGEATFRSEIAAALLCALIGYEWKKWGQ